MAHFVGRSVFGLALLGICLSVDRASASPVTFDFKLEYSLEIAQMNSIWFWGGLPEMLREDPACDEYGCYKLDVLDARWLEEIQFWFGPGAPGSNANNYLDIDFVLPKKLYLEIGFSDGELSYCRGLQYFGNNDILAPCRTEGERNVNWVSSSGFSMNFVSSSNEFNLRHDGFRRVDDGEYRFRLGADGPYGGANGGMNRFYQGTSFLYVEDPNLGYTTAVPIPLTAACLLSALAMLGGIARRVKHSELTCSLTTALCPG